VPTLLITICDNSGSVTSPGGTDPLSNRYAEAAHAFRIVARKGSQRELGAVLHFDTPCSGDVEPVPITRTGLAQLQLGLGVPRDGAGSSRLGPSLTHAGELAAAHPEHAVTLVVLSDYLLLDPDPVAVLARLGAFPGTVHAVVLGGRHATGLPTEHVTVTRIGRDDPPGAVAKAVFASLTRYRPGSRAFEAASTTEAAKRRAAPVPSRISQHNSAVRSVSRNRRR
jgi:hypothetical protein